MSEKKVRRRGEPFLSRMVRKGGFEPPRSCERQPLKLVRLPVPPLSRGGSSGLLPDESCAVLLRLTGAPAAGVAAVRGRRRRRRGRGCRRLRRRAADAAHDRAGPLRPMMPSTIAPSMNSDAEDRRRPRQHRRAGAGAERGLAAAAAERARHVAALALLQQDDEQQQQAGSTYRTATKVVEHNGRLYRALAAPAPRCRGNCGRRGWRRRRARRRRRAARTSSWMLSGLTLPP